ncbi:MAG: hypothetical protein U0R65_02535 [Candidatus Nanopelagicales bacterium]
MTAVLMAIDGITAAITVPVVTGGNTRLVAHVEVSPDPPTLPAVRAAPERSAAGACRAHQAVMRHAALPVNARGKVDRRALADGSSSAGDRGDHQPSSSVGSAHVRA